MDAGAVVLQLIGGNAVLRHFLLVRVAPAAGFRKQQGMNRRQYVLHRANIVDAVAVDTGGDVLVTLGQAFAVHAGFVQLVLIDALLRLIPPHEVRTAVAFGAELRDGGTLRLPDESLRRAHGNRRVVAIAVASVAIRAAQFIGYVNVVFDQQGGLLQRPFHGCVALDARVSRLGREKGRDQKNRDENAPHFTYPRTVNTAR